MKILFSHPGVGVFVQQSARALHEADMLYRYCTTFYSNKNSLSYKIISSLGHKFENNLRKREVTEVPVKYLKGIPQYELLRVLSAKLDKEGIITDKLHELSTNKFDKWVSENISENISEEFNAVYAYEYNALNTFEAAKKRGLFTIYEIPSPQHDYVHKIISEEIKDFPELNNNYYKHTKRFLKKRTDKRQREFEMADLVIVNSNLTKNSFNSTNLDLSKIQIVPLGCPPTVSQLIKTKNNPLKLIWAGTFSIRKGAHYLLYALKNAKNLDLELDVFGKIELPLRLIPEDNRINYKSTIPQTELLQKYHDYDLLIFPTLCDGFGMVITEALSQGLPVITTTRAGASDLIKDKFNGLVITPQSTEEIVNSISWCVKNREKLNLMRENALETGKKWQWEDYRKKLSDTIKNHFTL